MSYLQRLIDAQNTDLHAARAYLDRANGENRELSVEERTAWDALNAQMDDRQERIDDVKADEARQARISASLAEAPEARDDSRRDEPPVETVAAILRKMAKGEIREHHFESRANTQGTTTDGGYTVPESFGGRIIEKMLTVGPLLNPAVVNLLTTANTRDIPFPIENARATGTATAEATALGTSVPTFTEKVLKAYKYTAYVAASDELLMSEDVDIESYFAKNMGVALGTATNSILTTGTGTVQPEGIVAGGSGVTGGTGVSGVPTYENLVDLVHSVDSLYANSPSSGFMLKRSTLGSIRKITDTAGAYIFVPSANASMPSTVLGYPVYENPYVAATGTAAKSVWFGDWSYFIVRQVGGITVDRNDTVGWGSDLVYFKARTWIDSFVGQSEAIKSFAGGTA